MKILVTGAAGFIGYHLTIALLERGNEVVGLDNLNDYYDPQLKRSRLDAITAQRDSEHFTFLEKDISDRPAMVELFASYTFDAVVNLAAQAGVRYSIENPNAYVDSNLVGFLNILEGCRHSKVAHLVYASSSSVYGVNIKQPFSVDDRVDYPISLYAATKKSNELMAHTYSHLFDLPTTGLRFFTVYGPFGRPDMAYYKFTKAILSGNPIDIYNNGNMRRDFTYIDDVIEGLIRVIDRAPSKSSNIHAKVNAPYKVYNIGNNNPVTLNDFILSLEKACNKKAIKNFMPMQQGDVPSTYADIDDLILDINFKPDTNIDIGLSRFVNWYKEMLNIE